MLPLLVVAPLVVIAAFSAFVASRPSAFRVERRRRIAADPATLHALVNDFREWPAWSPWEKLDPAMKKDFGGPEKGTGASYHWVGNSKVGEGRMTITGSEAPRSLDLRLEFIKPWAVTNATRFEFTPKDGGTEVSWAMTGTHTFAMKAFGVFMDMDKLVGTDFENGLAAMETAAAQRRA